MRTSSDPKRAILLVSCLMLLAAAMIMSGCGNSDTSSAPTMPTTTAPQPHTSASGTAVLDKLSFDQLTLESPPTPEKDKHGLVFLRFKYADSDGKVYVCVLPRAMSEGQYTLAEWSSTFAAYRLPKVVSTKKGKKGPELGDYPFISPKPRQQEPVTTQPLAPPQGQPYSPIPPSRMPNPAGAPP